MDWIESSTFGTWKQPGAYQMDWYVPGKTLRFENGDIPNIWNSRRQSERIEIFISKGIYQDVLDWGFHALVETL